MTAWPLPDRFDHTSSDIDLPMLIDGQPTAASDGRTFASVNPFTGRTWARLPDASTEDVDRAVMAAHRAGTVGPWPQLSDHDRGQIIYRLADLIERESATLGRLETLDTGKLVRETQRQARFSARVTRFYAGYADKLDGRVVSMDNPALFDVVVHEPIGVCALLTAWNSPMQLLANKLPAALAAGNTVVIRPSEHAPGSTAFLGGLIQEAGFPPGVVNIVTSGGVDAARQLVRHDHVRMVSLTGGVATGRDVAGAGGQQLKRVVTELGGKSPQIIFADAGVDAAVAGVEAGIFAAGGQTCIAGSRLLIAQPLFDEVLARLISRSRDMKLGDPFDPTTDVGPLANDAQFARVSNYIDDGIAHGATLLTGGVDHELGGTFVRPSIFSDVRDDMAIAQEEIFGPVLVAMPFDDDDELIARANGTSFGLAAGIWTRDVGRALRTAKRLRAGSVWVNTYRTVAPTAPFGGTGQSGIGRERGLEGLLEFTQVKNIMIDTSI